MTKKLTLILTCLAFIVSGIAQPSPSAKFSERFQNIPSFENLQSLLPPKTIPQNKGNWYEPDIVYMFDTDGPTSHHIFAYANGKCLFNVMEYPEPGWPKLKYSYTYDAFDNIQEILAQEWKWEYFERWENWYKITYYYNTQNNLYESVAHLWSGDWRKFSKTSFTYNVQNNMTEKLSQRWEGEQLKNDLKYTYLYDSLNNMSEELIQKWESEQWKNDEQYIYLYDALNNLIEKLQHKWSSGSEEWLLPFKWVFTYDIQNNRTEELYQRSNQLNEWGNVNRVSYTYDEHNNASAGVYQKWGNSTWVDAMGVVNLHYNNMKSIWQYPYLHKFSATYINMNSQSMQDHSTESVIKLYPNPVSGILHVETGSNVAPEVKIFSIQGVLLLQTKGNEIDMSSLAKGIYFAEIDGVCRKVVKQ